MCFISCSHSSSKYGPGAITVYALNVNKYYPVTIKVNEEFSLSYMDLYRLTPGDKDGVLSK